MFALSLISLIFYDPETDTRKAYWDAWKRVTVIREKDEKSLAKNGYLDDRAIQYYIVGIGVRVRPSRIFLLDSLFQEYLQNPNLNMADAARHLVFTRANRRRGPLKFNPALFSVFLLPTNWKSEKHWVLYVVAGARLYLLDSFQKLVEDKAWHQKQAENAWKTVALVHRIHGVPFPMDTFDPEKDFETLDVPQQLDDISCGVFVCLFAKYVLRNPTNFMDKAIVESFKKMEEAVKIDRFRMELFAQIKKDVS